MISNELRKGMAMSYLYFKSKTDELMSDFTLYYCGMSAYEKKNSWGPGVRDYYSLCYVTEGEGYLTLNGQDYLLTKGMCFLVPPKVLVTYRPDPVHPWDYYFIAFNGQKIEETLVRIGLHKEVPILETPENHEVLEGCFQFILDAEKHPKSKDLHALSGFYALLSTLCELNEGPQPQAEKCNKQWQYVRDAMDFIEKNYTEPITVEEVSKYVGINRKYLTKLFNELVSDSPKSYLMNYRMERACELLKESELSIKEISHSVGYGDALVFSKVFKKIIGNCPREYRNQLSVGGSVK